jgi:hypothetical protein
MRPLSAAEAISPAIDRTKAILFQPFRGGRSWKLAATAYLSAMGLIFIPTPLILLFSPAHANGAAGAISRLFAAGFGIAFSAIMFLFFYIGSRLQFVLFAIVLERKEMVAPLWARYGASTWRWLGLKLLLCVAACIVSGVPMVYFFRSFVANMAIQPGQPPSPEFLGSILMFYAAIVIPILLLMLLSSLLSDFVLPSIALEDATLSNALGRFFQLIKTEPLPVLAFLAFKILLAIAGMIAVEITILIAEIVCAIPLGLLAFLGWFLFRSSGPVGHALIVAGGITLMLILIAFLFYLMFFVLGCLHTFFQAYALYFLGGRYPLLGNLLEPQQLPHPPLQPPSLPNNETGPAQSADPSPA